MTLLIIPIFFVLSREKWNFLRKTSVLPESPAGEADSSWREGRSTGGRRNFRIRGGPEFLPRRGMGICNPENPGIYYPCPKQSTL